MDAMREHVLCLLLVERKLLTDEDLRSIFRRREKRRREGEPVTLGELLVLTGHVGESQVAELSREVEERGRFCSSCVQTFIAAAGAPRTCPECGQHAAMGASGTLDDHPTVIDNVVIDLPTHADESVAAPKVSGTATTSPAGKTPSTRAISTLGPFDLLEELGRGAGGVVVKARHRERGDVVALKMLVAKPDTRAKRLARFDAEARTAKVLDHEGIVPVYDVGEIGDVHYFTMRFVEGVTLRALLRERRVTTSRAAQILRDVAYAVHHAHEHGIVHRDLKPENIIIDKATGRALVLDFGVAKDLEGDALTSTGALVGTPHYMSPEQARGRRDEIDPRSDVYGIGVVLYEALAGVVPFQAETAPELLRRINEDEPTPPGRVRWGVPPELEAIALMALRKRKEDRYRTAAALAGDLDRALEGRRIRAGPPSPWRARLVALRSTRLAALGAVGALAVGITLIVSMQTSRSLEREKLAEDDAAARRASALAAADAAAARQRDLAARRADAQTRVARAAAMRLEGQRATSAASARARLEDAARVASDALALAEADPELEPAARRERALALRDVVADAAVELPVADLAAGTSPGCVARPRLAAALLVLARLHDTDRARSILETVPTADRMGDAAPDEQAAALLAQGWLALLAHDEREATRRFKDAERLAGELAPEVGVSFAALDRTSPGASPAPLAADLGLERERWRLDLLVLRGLMRARRGDAAGAREDEQAARALAPGASGARAVAAAVAAIDEREDACHEALAAARREEPRARAYWDSLEAELLHLLAARRSRGAVDARPGPAPYEDFPVECDASVRARLDEARALASAGKGEEAVRLLERLEAEDRPHKALALVRASVLVETGHAAEARSIAEAVLAERPDEPFALAVLARADGSRAQALLERSVALAPRLRTPRLFLAEQAAQAGQWAAVAATLRPLLETDANDAVAGAAFARALVETGHADEAVKVARRAVRAAPFYALARNVCGTALHVLHRDDEALALADEGEKLAPGHWFMALEKGVALWCVKRWDDADRAFDRARAQAPEPARIEATITGLKQTRPR
jgi:hypothetical protein